MDVMREAVEECAGDRLGGTLVVGQPSLAQAVKIMLGVDGRLDEHQRSAPCCPINCVVCTENLNPNVLTMKSAQYRARIYDAGSLNLPRDRRILVQ
jgi:hypothetical protein